MTATEESLRESLFGERPAAHTLLAFVDAKPAAYATYFFTFASMVGKRGLWLDDLFVKADFSWNGHRHGTVMKLTGGSADGAMSVSWWLHHKQVTPVA